MLTGVSIWRALRDGEPRTRARLIQETGHSRAAVSREVDALFADGYIQSVGDAPSTGGRPATVFALNPRARIIAGIDLGATHCRVGITDLLLNVIADREERIRCDDDPARVVDHVVATIGELLDDIGCSMSDLAGAAMGVPAFIDSATGRAASSHLLPEWAGADVLGLLRRGLGDIALRIENDVDMMALGEHRIAFPKVNDLMFVKIATGVGAGLIIDGELRRGSEGSAGSLGHIAVPGREDVICSCGHAGCLEAVAGSQAVVDKIASDRGDRPTPAEISQLAASGDLRAAAILRDAGRDVGQILAACTSVLNPSVIVIGSDLAGVDEHLLAGIREAIYTRALPFTTANLTVVTTQVGPSVGVIGAAAIIADHVFSHRGFSELALASPARRDVGEPSS